MTQGYVPTTEKVKQAYSGLHEKNYYDFTAMQREENFDRWLAAHDAQIRADEHVKALELSDDETQIFANGIHAFTHEWGSFLDCDLDIGLDAVAVYRKEQKQ